VSSRRSTLVSPHNKIQVRLSLSFIDQINNDRSFSISNKGDFISVVPKATSAMKLQSLGTPVNPNNIKVVSKVSSEAPLKGTDVEWTN